MLLAMFIELNRASPRFLERVRRILPENGPIQLYFIFYIMCSENRNTEMLNNNSNSKSIAVVVTAS